MILHELACQDRRLTQVRHQYTHRLGASSKDPYGSFGISAPYQLSAAASAERSLMALNARRQVGSAGLMPASVGNCRGFLVIGSFQRFGGFNCFGFHGKKISQVFVVCRL